MNLTHLSHVLTAVGLNGLHLGEWLVELPCAKTRPVLFTRLMAQAVRPDQQNLASSIERRNNRDCKTQQCGVVYQLPYSAAKCGSDIIGLRTSELYMRRVLPILTCTANFSLLRPKGAMIVKPAMPKRSIVQWLWIITIW
jgi:hypothetical protein